MARRDSLKTDPPQDGFAVANNHELAITNPDKVLYPEGRFTKAEVVAYYLQVARWLLPHFRNRPVTLKRYPDGVFGFVRDIAQNDARIRRRQMSLRQSAYEQEKSFRRRHHRKRDGRALLAQTQARRANQFHRMDELRPPAPPD